jgi:hypothetical protein
MPLQQRPGARPASGRCRASALLQHSATAAARPPQVSGTVDQSGSMLSDDVADKGYALLCMAMPQSDCVVLTVTEVGGASPAPAIPAPPVPPLPPPCIAPALKRAARRRLGGCLALARGPWLPPAVACEAALRDGPGAAQCPAPGSRAWAPALALDPTPRQHARACTPQRPQPPSLRRTSCWTSS